MVFNLGVYFPLDLILKKMCEFTFPQLFSLWKVDEQFWFWEKVVISKIFGRKGISSLTLYVLTRGWTVLKPRVKVWIL